MVPRWVAPWVGNLAEQKAVHWVDMLVELMVVLWVVMMAV